MKKFAILAILATVLTSCASSGWSCQKRYVDLEEAPKNLGGKPC